MISTRTPNNHENKKIAQKIYIYVYILHFSTTSKF